MKPAIIEMDTVKEWPHTVPLFVTNLSEKAEFFKVTGLAAKPGRFVLEGKETERVLLTFEQSEKGIIRVAATRDEPGGLTTGTGMEIPFSVSGPSTNSLPLGADVSQAALPGALVVLFVLVTLWYVSTRLIRL